MTMRHARKQFRFATVWTIKTEKLIGWLRPWSPTETTVTTKKYRTQMVKKGESK